MEGEKSKKTNFLANFFQLANLDLSNQFARQCVEWRNQCYFEIRWGCIHASYLGQSSSLSAPLLKPPQIGHNSRHLLLFFFMTLSAHSLAHTRLFEPIQVGNCTLHHRVVHAPTSRCRSSPTFVATDHMLDYYKLRSSYAGTLVIFESTLVSELSGLSPRKPGAFTKTQREALGKIFHEIHANDSYVAVQLVAPGRVADVSLSKQYNLPLVAPSQIFPSAVQRDKAGAAGVELVELTEEQIRQIQDEFVDAAVGVLQESKADFVEIHGTSGFLVEQFLSPLSNQRTDRYGGSIENRARFFLELVDRFAAEPGIGALKTGVRIAPWSTHNGMNYPEYPDISQHPALQMSEYLLRELQKRRNEGNLVAYVSIVEPRVSGNADVAVSDDSPETNDSLLPLFDGPLIRSGAYATNYAGGLNDSSESVGEVDETFIHYEQLMLDVNADHRTLIGLSRPFTSNPDLVERLKLGLELTPYEREYFYTHTRRGYMTFGKYDEEVILAEDELDRLGTPLVE